MMFLRILCVAIFMMGSTFSKGFTPISFGSPTAPIKVIMYYSAMCAHCATYEAEELPKLKPHFDSGALYLEMRPFVGFSTFDPEIVKLSWSNGENPYDWVQRFMKHQEEWLDPCTEGSEQDRIKALDKRLKAFCKKHGTDLLSLKKKLSLNANLKDSILTGNLRLFALEKGMPLQDVEKSIRNHHLAFNAEEMSLEVYQPLKDFEAANQKEVEFGLPAFVVNGRYLGTGNYFTVEKMESFLNKEIEKKH